jgi:hypothetical protein
MRRIKRLQDTKPRELAVPQGRMIQEVVEVFTGGGYVGELPQPTCSYASVPRVALVTTGARSDAATLAVALYSLKRRNVSEIPETDLEQISCM